MLRFPIGVIVLNLLIHPTEHRTNLCRIMAGASHDSIDGMPKTVRGKPSVTRLVSKSRFSAKGMEATEIVLNTRA